MNRNVIFTVAAVILVIGVISSYAARPPWNFGGQSASTTRVSGININNLKYLSLGSTNVHLSNGQYLSDIIHCNENTCPNGERAFEGLDQGNIIFDDFNADGKIDAIAGFRSDYVPGRDDLINASNDARFEFLGLVELENGKPQLVDGFGGTKGKGIDLWEAIHTIKVQNGHILVDVTESVDHLTAVANGDQTGKNEIRRVYTLAVTQNKFTVLDIMPYSAIKGAI